jgi:hypothetical protein
MAARGGDFDYAVTYGRQALNGDRKSLPSLVMVSRDLARTLEQRYADEQSVQDYLGELRGLSA